MDPPLTNDEDLEALFDRMVVELREEFDYSAESAEATIREYYRLFRDPEYCKSIGVVVHDAEFFFHETAGGMALRIHYYMTVKADPDPGAFIEWRAQYNRNKELLAARYKAMRAASKKD